MQADCVALTFDTCGFCTEENINSIFAKDLLYLLRDIRIFTCEQLLSRLDDRHTASETAEQLAKLQPDISSTENEQMVRYGVEFHDGDIVESVHGFEAVKFGSRGASACVDEDSCC